MTPEEIVQGQLNDYNKQDIDAFLEWYWDDVEIYSYPEEFSYKGKEQMRIVYQNLWQQHPNQKVQLLNRISVGNTVMDKEHVIGRENAKEFDVIAIFTIQNHKIKEVRFVSK